MNLKRVGDTNWAGSGPGADASEHKQPASRPSGLD
jgi:hypothetical protein